MDKKSKTHVDNNVKKAHVDYKTMYEIFVYNDRIEEWVSTTLRYSSMTEAIIQSIRIYPEMETKVEPVYDGAPAFRLN